MPSVGSAQMSITTSASIMFIEAARRFAARAAVLDDPAIHNGLENLAKQARASELVDTVLAAILTASSAVEAIVNELYVERALFPNNTSPWFKGLPDDVARAFADAWRNGVKRNDIVTKCQIATAIAGKKRIDFGGGAAQQMQLLIDHRNALVHHKPVTVGHVTDPSESADAIERKLHRQFELSRICDASYTFRWHRCLGAGCARWAHETAEAFQRDFFARLGTDYLKPPADATSAPA